MRTREYAFYMAWDADEGVWVTHVPDLNGLSTYGETPEEAVVMTQEAIELYLETITVPSLALVTIREPVQGNG